MKKIILLAAIMASTLTATAQSYTIQGRVTDQYGNAIPNAEVRLDHSNIVTHTWMNGAFELKGRSAKEKVIISSTGRKSIKKKAEPYMEVRMKPLTWWNETPTKWNIFAGVEMLTTTGGCMPVGVRIAAAKQFGLYAHFAMTTMPDNMGKAQGNIISSGKYKTGSTVFGAGGMIRLWSPIYFYAGVGYRNDRVFIEHLTNSTGGTPDGYVEIDEDWADNSNYGYNSWETTFEAWKGLEGEFGFMFNYKLFYVNAGLYTSAFELDNSDTMFHIGAGIKF